MCVFRWWGGRGAVERVGGAGGSGGSCGHRSEVWCPKWIVRRHRFRHIESDRETQVQVEDRESEEKDVVRKRLRTRRSD